MNPLVAAEAADHFSQRRAVTALSVNVNKVALLRNSRHLGIPSVVNAARWALEAGADGVTVHPRPDERHIRARDVPELAAMMKDWPQAEFNIEGNPFHNLMDVMRDLAARGLHAHQCTFVPDSEGQATSDHGWDLAADGERLRPLIAQAQALGQRVSLFMDPEPAAMARVREIGADRVELYTEPYAAAWGTPAQAAQLARFAAGANAATQQGLLVNAGHDLNRDNLAEFLRQVPGVMEVSIGHALVADALELGIAVAVRAYQRCIRSAFAPA
jgi:pyridoxine 5-phosphate synthase